MDVFDKLFSFPIVMIDGDHEEKKERMKDNLDNPLITMSDDEYEEYDIIYGEAEYPFDDFAGIEDRWIPRKKSFDRALTGKFDACIVRFDNVGTLLVPWNKTRFKAELLKFEKAYKDKLNGTTDA